MTQEPPRDPLQDYMDGLLSDEEREALASRLEQDHDLMSDLEGMRALRESASRLPEAIEPDRDLWPAIATGIGVPHRRRPSRFGSGFAFAAAIVVLLSALLLWRERPEPLLASNTRADEQEIAAMERILSAAEIELAPALVLAQREDENPEFGPLREAVQHLSQALNESLTAWKKDPEDEVARRDLLRVNRQRVRFARRIVNLQARI